MTVTWILNRGYEVTQNHFGSALQYPAITVEFPSFKPPGEMKIGLEDEGKQLLVWAIGSFEELRAWEITYLTCQM